MLNRRTLLTGLAAAPVAAMIPTFAAAQSVLGTGSFTGASRHVTTGTGQIIESGGKYYVRLGTDFTFDGAPDPKVALGNNGYDKSTLMGALRSNTGAQDYEIPAAIDVTKYNQIWIWCERFNVPLGVAELT